MRDLTDLEVSGNLPRFVMPGWCEGAYLLAAASSPHMRARIRENESADDLTGGPESLEDLIESKLYHAGISCRYMFDYSVPRIVSDILSAVMKAPNLQGIKDGLVGPQSSAAVNRLTVTRTSEASVALTFTSNYVASLLGETATPETIKSMFEDYI